MMKIGIIGCGAPHAVSSHLPILASFPDVELTAFCDIDQTKLDTTMNTFQAKSGFTDFRQMLDEINLDAVFVIVRPALLKDIVLECLKRSIPVSLEKSPGTTSAQTREMSEEAQRRNCLNMVGFDRRYALPVLAAKHTVGKRRPREVTGVFERAYKTPCDPMEAIIHGLDMMRFWGGDVDVMELSPRRGEEGIRAFELRILFQEGAIGKFYAKNYCHRNQEYYSVNDGSGETITADVANGTAKRNGTEIPLRAPEPYRQSAPIHKLKGYWENRHFIDCVKSGKMPTPNLEDSLKTMEMAEFIKTRI